MPQQNRLWETSRTPYAPVLGKYRPNGSYGSYRRVSQPVIPDPPAICLTCENRGRLSPGPSSDTWGLKGFASSSSQAGPNFDTQG
jgi:hypothetical protein